MKTLLNFKSKRLIEIINFKSKNYQVEEESKSLIIYKKGKKRPMPVKIPKEIKISPQTVGLIVGEGYIGDRVFVFANSNEKAIDLVLEFIKQFNLPIKNYLEVSTKNMPKDFAQKSSHFWEKHMNTKISRTRERKEFNNITKYGTMHLSINSKIIAEILTKIIKKSKEKIEKNKTLSIEYLKGIIAAEGNINIKKTTNCVYMVRISATKQDERDHYKRCLHFAGLNIFCKDMLSISKEEAKQKGWKTEKGRAGCVIISRWENFIKILEMGLLDINEDKKSKFLKSFVNNKFTIQFISFKDFFNKEFKIKEAQEYFKFSGRYVNRVLTLFKQGYISRRKFNQRDYSYKLTQKYYDLYNLFKEEGLIN